MIVAIIMPALMMIIFISIIIIIMANYDNYQLVNPLNHRFNSFLMVEFCDFVNIHLMSCLMLNLIICLQRWRVRKITANLKYKCQHGHNFAQ